MKNIDIQRQHGGAKRTLLWSMRVCMFALAMELLLIPLVLPALKSTVPVQILLLGSLCHLALILAFSMTLLGWLAAYEEASLSRLSKRMAKLSAALAELKAQRACSPAPARAVLRR